MADWEICCRRRAAALAGCILGSLGCLLVVSLDVVLLLLVAQAATAISQHESTIPVMRTKWKRCTITSGKEGGCTYAAAFSKALHETGFERHPSIQRFRGLFEACRKHHMCLTIYGLRSACVRQNILDQPNLGRNAVFLRVITPLLSG